MQWNKKWLILCAAALIAVAGVLLGKGIRQQTTSTPKFASETELAVPISGPAASRSAAEKKEKNDAQKTSPPKKEEKEKKSAAPDRKIRAGKSRRKAGRKKQIKRKNQRNPAKEMPHRFRHRNLKSRRRRRQKMRLPFRSNASVLWISGVCGKRG